MVHSISTPSAFWPRFETMNFHFACIWHDEGVFLCTQWWRRWFIPASRTRGSSKNGPIHHGRLPCLGCRHTKLQAFQMPSSLRSHTFHCSAACCSTRHLMRTCTTSHTARLMAEYYYIFREGCRCRYVRNVPRGVCFHLCCLFSFRVEFADEMLTYYLGCTGRSAQPCFSVEKMLEFLIRKQCPLPLVIVTERKEEKKMPAAFAIDSRQTILWVVLARRLLVKPTTTEISALNSGIVNIWCTVRRINANTGNRKRMHLVAGTLDYIT